MTREEELDWLCRLKSEIYVYMPKEWLIPMNNALDIAISDLSENKGEDRPKGHWIENGYVGNDNYLFECSECHHTDTQSKAVKVNYCWYCGADMRGKA